MSALTRPEQGHRIDHQGYAPEIWAGLLITALYLLQSEPLVVTIADRLEFALDGVLAVGSALCLLGAASGTRWFFPKTPKRCSYRFHLLGLPLIVAALAWYTYAAADAPDLILVALGGGLGLCLEIASVRMVVEIVEDLKDSR
jgi:hypothetical protein